MPAKNNDMEDSISVAPSEGFRGMVEEVGSWRPEHMRPIMLHDWEVEGPQTEAACIAAGGMAGWERMRRMCEL